MFRHMMVFVICLAALSSPLSALSSDPHWPYSACCRIVKPIDNSGGSGTLIAREGRQALVVTNHHVVGNEGDVKVGWPLGPVDADGYVLYASRRVDLALIVCEAPTAIEPAIIAPFNREDGPFVACGFPSYSRTILQVQQGDVADIWDQTVVLDCEHKPGMSGGTIFNSRGELSGVIWGHNWRNRTGMSVPAEYLLEFLEPFLESENIGEPVNTGTRELLPLSPLPEANLCLFGRRGGGGGNYGPPPFMQQPQWFPAPPDSSGEWELEPGCQDGTCWRKKKQQGPGGPQQRGGPFGRQQPTQPYDPKTAPKFKLPRWPGQQSDPSSPPQPSDPSTPSAPPSEQPTTPDSEQATAPPAPPSAPELAPIALANQLQQVQVTLEQQQSNHAKELAQLEQALAEANKRLVELLARPVPETKIVEVPKLIPGEVKIVEVPKIVPGETKIVEVKVPVPTPPAPVEPKPTPPPAVVDTKPTKPVGANVVYYEVRRTK